MESINIKSRIEINIKLMRNEEILNKIHFDT